ncbi:MAG: HAMP domain-containing histidine kinase [Elusimicrobia bacterium]|nr:HAMP domain-containing histidine kinase [Elusimicrobiota bacterium]
MKLALQLSVVLAGLILAIVCGSLLMTYRSERAHLEENQDAYILAGVERLAAHCGASAGPDFERHCLEGLHFLIQMTAPRAFTEAVLIEPSSLVLIHSDFLSGDASLRNQYATNAYAHLAVTQREPTVLKDMVVRNVGHRIFSCPVVGPQGRVGTMIAAYRESALRESLAWLEQDARRRFLQACLTGTGLAILFSVGWVLYALSPLSDLVRASRRVAEGDFSHRVSVTRDDELGRLGGEFNRMIARLEELDDLKDSFMAKITHDLRNPLNAMIGYAELCRGGFRGPLTQEQADAMKLIVQNGNSLAELINNILDVTQLEAGRMNFSPSVVDLQSEVGGVLELLQLRADQFQVRLESALLPELDQVFADPQAFRRVLINLVSNALKFTPAEGSVTVKAYRGTPNEVVVAISDTGVGIPPQRLSDLFKKFSQVQETLNKVRPSGGTGLGLVICKEIVEAHGGRIWAESAPGQGTTFLFTLPEREPKPGLDRPRSPHVPQNV